jgi:hypothetical protein
MFRKATFFALLVVFMIAALAVAQEAKPMPKLETVTLNLISPKNGETWDLNSTQTVAWELDSPMDPDSIQIWLSTPSPKTELSAESQAAKDILLATILKGNPGKWLWNKVEPAAEKLKIEVRVFLSGKIKKVSHTFMVVAKDPVEKPDATPQPALEKAKVLPKETPEKPDISADLMPKILSPKSGEKLFIGSVKTVSWSVPKSTKPTPVTETYSIFLSRDGGVTYPEVLSKDLSPSTTSFDWTVSGPASEHCKISLTTGQKPAKGIKSAAFVILDAVKKPINDNGHTGQ